MAGIGPVAAPPVHFSMVVTAAPSPFCSPEKDPFLLLQSTLSCVERILQRSDRPLLHALCPNWCECKQKARRKLGVRGRNI